MTILWQVKLSNEQRLIILFFSQTLDSNYRIRSLFINNGRLPILIHEYYGILFNLYNVYHNVPNHKLHQAWG